MQLPRQINPHGETGSDNGVVSAAERANMGGLQHPRANGDGSSSHPLIRPGKPGHSMLLPPSTQGIFSDKELALK